jgi:hypothetical protein
MSDLWVRDAEIRAAEEGTTMTKPNTYPLTNSANCAIIATEVTEGHQLDGRDKEAPRSFYGAGG